MALPTWPRPPTVTGLSTENAVNAFQCYVRDVQNHVGHLRLDSTEYGVVIGFMLSSLDNATKIFDRTCREPGTSPDIRHDISMFQAAMQSLTAYMENAKIESDSTSQASEVACDQSEDDIHVKVTNLSEKSEYSDSVADALHPTTKSRQKNTSLESIEARTIRIKVSKQGLAILGLQGIGKKEMAVRILQDAQDQGIRVPLFVCGTSMECITLLTSSIYNVAVLRNTNFWKPRIFGKDAYVEPPSSSEDAVSNETTTLPKYVARIRKAEEKARTNARLVWIEIPDRKFAEEELARLDNHAVTHLIEQDTQNQNIALRITCCKKSPASRHIRLWTSDPKDVKVLVDEWRPTVFGTGAYVRWQIHRIATDLAARTSQNQPKNNNAGLTASSSEAQPVDDDDDDNDAESYTSHSKGTIVRKREVHDVTSQKESDHDTAVLAASTSQSQPHDDDETDDTESSSSRLGVSALINPETRRMQQVLREVFVELPDHDYAKNKLFVQRTAKIKALVGIDLETQKIHVEIAHCEPIRGAKPRLLLQTNTPEQAQHLRTPGAWTPSLLGPGAYVDTS